MKTTRIALNRREIEYILALFEVDGWEHIADFDLDNEDATALENRFVAALERLKADMAMGPVNRFGNPTYEERGMP